MVMAKDGEVAHSFQPLMGVSRSFFWGLMEAKWPIRRSRPSCDVKSIGGKQRQLQQVLENKEKRRILQKLTQIGGVQRYKNELRLALAEA